MNAQFSVSATLLSSANYLVCGIADASAPNVILQTIAPTKAGSPPYYPTPFQVTFTGLTYGTAYIFRLYESPDMTAQGTVRNYSEFTALGQSIAVRATLFIIADTTMGFASGQPSYVDSSVIEWTFDVANGSQGFLNPATVVTINTDGFTLIGRDAQPAEEFSLHFAPQIATAPPPPAAGVSSGSVLTADTVLDNAAVNTEICLQGAVAAYFTITLPGLSTVADYAPLWFNSAGGSHVNVVIKCAGADTIQRKTAITQMVLGQNEYLKLYKARGKWFVEAISATADQIGRYLFSPAAGDVNSLNLMGQTVLRNVYYRIWLWVNGPIGPGTIVQSTWANTDAYGNYINKGFYGDGDGSTTFTLPLIKGFVSSLNGSASPGIYSIQNVGAHKHLGGLSISNGGTPGGVYGSAATDTPGSSTAQFSPVVNTPAVRQLLTGPNMDNLTLAKITNNVNKPADIGVYLNVTI